MTPNYAIPKGYPHDPYIPYIFLRFLRTLLRNAHARENSSFRLAKVTLLGLLHQRSLTKSLNENKSGPYISDDLGYCKDRASRSRSYKAWFLGRLVAEGLGFRSSGPRASGILCSQTQHGWVMGDPGCRSVALGATVNPAWLRERPEVASHRCPCVMLLVLGLTFVGCVQSYRCRV